MVDGSEGMGTIETDGGIKQEFKIWGINKKQNLRMQISGGPW